MSQSGGVALWIVLLIVVFVVVLIIMAIGLVRARRRTPGNAPVVGTGTVEQANTNPNKLQYRMDSSQMDADIGGNLREVPDETQSSDSTRQPRH